MIAIAMSLFTMAAGLARSFPMLLAMRMGVGITEAGGSPPTMRAMTHALWTMASNLVGMGLGPLLVGALSASFATASGSDSIRYALLIVSAVALFAAVSFSMGARRAREDLA